jgi:hypothetical protein
MVGFWVLLSITAITDILSFTVIVVMDRNAELW